MRIVRSAVALVGAACVAAAALLATGAAGAVPAELAELAGAVPTERLVLLLGGGAALYGIWRTWAISRVPYGTSPLVEREPERVHGSPVVGAGAGFDSLLDRTDAGRERTDREQARRDVHGELAEMAVRLRMEATGVDRTTAEAAVDRGEWTDDARAAAFLGGPDAPAPPWTVRLRDWLSAEDVFARRVDHAVGALEAAYEREIAGEADR